MPECQVSRCINKAGEGASKGKKIFQIKIPCETRAALMASHYWNGDSLELVTKTHNVDQLVFNRKIVFEDHFTERYFKKRCGALIVVQFVHRHQATDAIAPRQFSHCHSQTCSAIA